MGGFIYKSQSAFLVKRTIWELIRKVLRLAVNGMWGK